MVLKVVFHLIPLLGVYLEKPVMTIALVLFLALPYIKVKKLSFTLEEEASRHPSTSEAASVLGGVGVAGDAVNTDGKVNAEEPPKRGSLEAALVFWKKFTFLP